MAVTRNPHTIILGAANDAVTGKMKIQGMALDHTAAANATIQDSGNKVIATLRTTTTVLRDWVEFPRGMTVDGVKASTLSAGTVYIFLADE